MPCELYITKAAIKFSIKNKMHREKSMNAKLLFKKDR